MNYLSPISLIRGTIRYRTLRYLWSLRITAISATPQCVGGGTRWELLAGARVVYHYFLAHNEYNKLTKSLILPGAPKFL